MEQTRAPLAPGVTVFLIRHGETDWNRDARYQGQRDIPLNDTGRAQAARNGAALKALGLDLSRYDFVASPMQRALETMRIIRTELGLDREDFARDERLKELHYGHWEGQLASELGVSDPISVAAKARDPHGWRPRGGESYADLQVRVADWLSTVQRDTIAVTHGGVSRVARGAVLGLPTSDIPFLDVPQNKVLKLSADGMDWV